MLLTEEQSIKFVERFKENYSQYCPIDEDGKLWIAIIYCENPKAEEEIHRQMWLEEIKKIMWKDSNKKYTHKWWRTESFAEAQCAALRLYCGPTFKEVNKKK